MTGQFQDGGIVSMQWKHVFIYTHSTPPTSNFITIELISHPFIQLSYQAYTWIKSLYHDWVSRGKIRPLQFCERKLEKKKSGNETKLTFRHLIHNVSSY